MTEITNFGTIKKIAAPASWKKVVDANAGIGTRQSEYFHPPEDAEVNITVYYRGMPIDDASAAAFKELLATQSGTARALSPSDIAKLSDVMGASHLGDNQYTNSAAKGARNYPVFNLVTATLVSVQGRPALKCRGNFQNEHGVPGTEYEGLFFPGANSGVIEEIYFQAPTRGKFLRFSPDFEKCLATLEWA